MRKIKITAELIPVEECGYIEVIGIENIPHFTKGHQIKDLDIVINE